ncbi:MAG: hypothetical protein IAE99_07940 [Rhodothermales bacterium]|nr:hypothetical protein [Rhodothermales bacterium]
MSDDRLKVLRQRLERTPGPELVSLARAALKRMAKGEPRLTAPVRWDDDDLVIHEVIERYTAMTCTKA